MTSVLTWISLYIMIWFICLMPVINTGMQNHVEADTKPSYGSDLSSPIKPNLKPKFILTSLVAGGVWLILLVIYVWIKFNPA